MATKDYIYLAIVALTALYFYRRGFRIGVSRTRKIWKRLLERAAPTTELPAEPEPFPLEGTLLGGRRAHPVIIKATLPAVFGKN